jgi:Leucine-rich repeat (LRR) protein
MAGISLILQNNPTVTQINCGTSSPRLGGTINLSAFPNLQEFRCNNNDITAISGYENNANLRNIQFQENLVTGSISSLSGLSNLQDFRCSANQLTGPIPSLSGLSNLQVFRCSANQLTGLIPSLSGLNILRVFYCHTNQLTGPIPSLSGLSNLQDFRCSANQLTGSIPSLADNPLLSIFRCHRNQLSGNIPTLSANTALEIFECYTQQGVTRITGFDGGSVSNTLGRFEAQSNQLTSTAVNAILAAFVAANRTAGTRVLNLGGAGNAAPTGQGITDKATLVSRGWTVTTN